MRFDLLVERSIISLKLLKLETKHGKKLFLSQNMQETNVHVEEIFIESISVY